MRYFFFKKRKLKKYPVSQRKRRKTFSSTLALSFCFHLFTLKRFRMKTQTFGYVFAYRHRFQKPPFSPVHTTNEAFSKRARLLKWSLKASVFTSIFGRLNVDYSRKPIKVCVFIRKHIRMVGAIKAKRFQWRIGKGRGVFFFLLALIMP